jgi:1-pyrroline-5-carboxylate dehydrogenase
MSAPAPFRNESLADFADPAVRRAQESALRAFKPASIPLVIGGRRLKTRARLVSTDPCAPRERLGDASSASAAQADAAVVAADRAFRAWSRTPAAARAAVLVRAAALMRERRWDLNAVLVREVAKTWVEADADTAEAVDFCEYYAAEALRYDLDQPLTPLPGELNRLRYRALGAGVSISPWNFPCAILAGMAAAAVVTGNTVVMKPASIAPLIAWRIFGIFEEAGLPPGVLNLLPGSGGEVGDRLVDHPRVRFVSFTGSREVGVRLHERAARVHPGQRGLKRTVIEMGGKDAIVVDADADLDAAAGGIVASAFGYQGQKCSACSRVIALGSVHDRLLERVVDRTKALRIGDASDPSTQVSALASAGQLRKVARHVALGRREGRLVCGGRRLDREGHFLEPAVFAGVKPSARLAQEEIFGPVLAFLKADDFDEAMAIANGTEYGLTGAYYGHRNLERAAETFDVGNLYLNRKCTGALVGAHPFGGFHFSGTNSKAGGPDYLRLFLESKLVARRV